MTEKEKRSIGSGMLDRLIKGQREGKSPSEVAEGIRAGLASDYLSLDEGLRKGSTIVDPAKYVRATDGKDERPRKTGPFVRDINERIARAKQEVAEERQSSEYRSKVVRQKKAQIHKVMNERGTNELTASIRGYDVTLLRLPETDQTGEHKLKMFVNGSEIPDKNFNEALAEVAGLNDSKAFNASAQVGKELRDQAGIQGARTATQAGLHAVGAPVRAVKDSAAKNQQLLGQLLGMFFRAFITMSRAR